MNVHHLELFYYVARHGGISRALPYMPYGIQQPAVSSQIIALERDLGQKLFERRPFGLTTSGERLYRFARPFFSQLPAMHQALKQGMEVLRVGAGEMLIRNYLPRSLATFRRRVPGVTVSLKTHSTVALLAQVQSDEIDVALVPVPPGTPSGLTWTPLVDIELALMAPKSHPARTAGALLKRADRGSLISMPAGEPMPDLFQIEMTRRGLQWLPEIELTHLSLMESYVESGLGVGVTVNLPVKSEAVAVLPLRRFPKLRIAACHKGRAGAAVESLVEILRRDARRLESK